MNREDVIKELIWINPDYKHVYSGYEISEILMTFPKYSKYIKNNRKGYRIKRRGLKELNDYILEIRKEK